MNRWRRFAKKIGVSLLSVAMIAGMTDYPAVKVMAQENFSQGEVTIIEDSILLPEMETSALPVGFFGLREGSVDLKAGNWEKWIDRVDVSEAAFVKELYDNMVEASDNDGVDDWLIEDSYFEQEEYKVVVTEVQGSMATIGEAQSIMSSLLNQYAPFIYAAVNAFDRDHPEVFWLSGSSKVGISMKYGATEAGFDYWVTLSLHVKTEVFDIRAEEYKSQSLIESGIQKRDAKVAEITGAVSGLTDYEKMVYFNDYLTKSNQYNTSNNLSNIGHDCRECISALEGRIGTVGPVCEAYARAFKILCDVEGIPCVLVDGYAKSSASDAGGAHMWNYAKLEGNWYGVDVTWNDPTGGASGAVSGYECDDYLLVGSETMKRNMTFLASHPVTNCVAYSGLSFVNGPILNDRKYEYAAPTATPTAAPTATPTAAPTATPTAAPTATPTVAPTATPTVAPTATPGVVWPMTGQCGEAVYWELDSKGTMTISGTGEMWDFDSIYEKLDCECPWEVNKEKIVNVIFEKGVTNVGVNAFRDCINLKSVLFADTITSIGNFAFLYCSNLKDLILPSDLCGLGQQAFASCINLISLQIPDSVNFIDAEVFGGCTSLTEVYIGGNAEVPSYAYGNCIFRNCSALEKIQVSEENFALKSVDGVLYSKDGKTLVQYPCGKKDKKYSVVKGTDYIYPYAMEGAKYIEEIVIPISVTKIGEFAMHECEKLQYIRIPKRVESIGEGNGLWCNSLKYIINDSATDISLINWDFMDKEYRWVDENGNQISVLKPGKVGFINEPVEVPAPEPLDIYSIAFDGNGATAGSMSSMEDREPDVTYTLPANNYKRTGYTFVGWNTKADGTGVSFANKAEVKNLGTDEETITLYAQWKVVKYTIKYYLDGGKNSDSNPSSYDVTKPTFSLKEPVRCGYRFDGWYTNSDYTVKASVTIKQGTTGDKEYYAKWIATGEDHDWDAGVVTKEATEAATGSKTYTCKVCGSTKTETIPVLIPIPEKPYKITNVISGIHVYWNAVKNAEKYGLWRSETGKDGTYRWIANPKVAHFTDTTVESGKTYYYKVSVLSSVTGTHGNKSEAIGITYVSTPDITGRSNKAAGVQLNWNSIKGATGYAIYRKSYEGKDEWVRLATITSADTLTWTDGSVKDSNGKIYRYTIRALAGKNRNVLSGCRPAGRTMVRLTSRTLSEASKMSANAIRCKWTTTSQATGYEVRFMVGNIVYKTFTINDYKTGAKLFTNLKSGQTYKIQIRSYKKVEGIGTFYSAWSVAQNVKM